MPHGIDPIDLKKGFQILQLLIGDKSHGNARPTHPAGPSCSVCVGFQATGIVIIDHMTDVTEVESPAGNVRGNHQGNLVLAKPLEDRSPPRLFQTSVDVLDRFEFSFELLFQRRAMMP